MGKTIMALACLAAIWALVGVSWVGWMGVIVFMSIMIALTAPNGWGVFLALATLATGRLIGRLLAWWVVDLAERFDALAEANVRSGADESVSDTADLSGLPV